MHACSRLCPDGDVQDLHSSDRTSQEETFANNHVHGVYWVTSPEFGYMQVSLGSRRLLEESPATECAQRFA